MVYIFLANYNKGKQNKLLGIIKIMRNKLINQTQRKKTKEMQLSIEI